MLRNVPANPARSLAGKIFACKNSRQIPIAPKRNGEYALNILEAVKDTPLLAIEMVRIRSFIG